MSRKKKTEVELVQRKNLNPFSFEDFIIKKPTPVKIDTNLSLFEEKHKPTKVNNIVGHKKNIEKMQKWINKKKENKESKKFLTIFGPNGVGKSLIAELLLKENGYKIFELNSDIYPQKKEMLLKFEKVISSKSIQKLVSGSNPTAIIVDNIEKTLGEGVTYTNFIDLIVKHKTDVPIICISSSEKIKKKYNTPTKLEIIQLDKPSLEDLIKYGAKILKRENIQITKGAITQIIQASKFDIRKFLQYLKVCSLSDKKKFDNENIQPILNFSETDTFYNAYEAMNDFLKEKDTKSLNEKIKMCIIDQPLIIDLIYTNIPYLLDIENMHEAFDPISFSDIIQVKIFKEQCWELREYLISSSCIEPVNVIRKNKNVKKSYVIKKNQLNNLPCTCVKNNNIFEEINKKSKIKINKQDLIYSIKYIYNPKIDNFLKENDTDSLREIVKELLNYGLDFNCYQKVSQLGFNKSKAMLKKDKDKLVKIWGEFDRKNLTETVKIKKK